MERGESEKTRGKRRGKERVDKIAERVGEQRVSREKDLSLYPSTLDSIIYSVSHLPLWFLEEREERRR